MSVLDGRIELKQLTLQVYDLISSSLADSRTLAVSNASASSSKPGQAAFRSWVAASASLLHQLLEVSLHPAGTFDSRRLTNAQNLSSTVDSVGSTLLTLRTDQSVSQRSAAALSLLEVRPPASAHLSAPILLRVVQGLHEAGIPCTMRSSHIHLVLCHDVYVQCRLEREEVEGWQGRDGHGQQTDSRMQLQEDEDARGRLVLQPVIRSASDESAAASAGSDNTPSTLPPFLPPPPSLLPLLEMWISRLHERVPPCEAEEGGRVPVEQRVKHLTAVYAALSAQCNAALLSYAVNYTLRCAALPPLHPMAKVGPGHAIARVQAAAPLTALQDNSKAVVHAGLHRSTLPQLPALRPSAGPPEQREQEAITPGWYVQHIGAGYASVLVGRIGEVPMAELARILLACSSTTRSDASAVHSLLTAGPSATASAVVEADAKAYDAATGRSVVAARAVRPLPAPFRAVLTWLCEQGGHTPPEPPLPPSAPPARTEGGQLGQEGSAGDSVAPLAVRVHAAQAVLKMLHCSALSPDYQACSLGVHHADEHSRPVQPVIVLQPHALGGKFTQHIPLTVTEHSLSHALHSCRSESARLVYQWALSLLSCRSLPAQEGLIRTEMEEEGAGQHAVRVELAAYGITLHVSLTGGSEGSRLVMRVIGPTPSCHTPYMPTQIQGAVAHTGEQVTAQLQARKLQLSQLICSSKSVPNSSRLASLPAAEALHAAPSLLSAPLPGYMTGMTAGQALTFYGGLTSSIGLARVVEGMGACSLSSILRHSLARLQGGGGGVSEAGVGTGDVEDSSSGAGAAILVQQSGISVLGAPLQTGSDVLLSASLALKCAHDAELLSLLSHDLGSSMEEVVQGAREVAERAYGGEEAAALQVVHSLCKSSRSGGAQQEGIGALRMKAVDDLLRTVADGTGWSHSQIYQALHDPTASSPPSSPLPLSVTHISIARKFAALHAVAVAQGIQEAIDTVHKLWPLQAMAATLVEGLQLPAPAADMRLPPLFLQQGQGQGQGQEEVSTAQWAALPVHRPTEGGGGEGTWEGWLRLGTQSAALTLCAPVPQCGTLAPAAAQAGGGGTHTALHGVMALGVVQEASTQVQGTARWATQDEVASLGPVATMVSSYHAGHEEDPLACGGGAQVLVLQCSADVLRACSLSKELCDHISQGRGLPPSFLQVQALVSSLSTLCRAVGGRAILLLPAHTDTAGAIAAVEEGYICSAYSQVPVLWATGAAGQLVRRLISPAPASSFAPSRPGVGVSKVGMFGRTGQAGTTTSTALQGAGTAVSIRLPKPTSQSLLRVLLSHRWPVQARAGSAASSHGQGSAVAVGVKRSRPDMEQAEEPTAETIQSKWRAWMQPLLA